MINRKIKFGDSDAYHVKYDFGGTTIYSCPALYYGSDLAFRDYNEYVLTFSAATISITVTCNRTSSPNAGASTGPIYSGNTIYTGDVLQFTVTSSSGYYVSEATTRDSTSYTETITVSSNVNKQYKAVKKLSVAINTTSSSFSSGGRYPWSQSFVVTNDIYGDSSNPYYPYVAGIAATTDNGYISSASATGFTASGWSTSGGKRVRGTCWYYNYAVQYPVAPVITNVNESDGRVTFTIKNNNPYTVTLHECYEYSDSSDEYYDSGWFTNGTISSNSSTSITIYTQTGARFDWLDVWFQFDVEGYYSDEIKYSL